jgi:hypothetical protein
MNDNSNGELFGSIYAPNANVNLDSVVYGFVVAASTTVNSKAAVHRDTNLSCVAASTPSYSEADYVIPPFSTSCPTGTIVVWRFFNWDANTPNSSHIDFYAQTSNGLTAYQPAYPGVLIGSAWNENGTLWYASGTGIGACADSGPDAGACGNLETIESILTSVGVTEQANMQIVAKMYPDSTGAYAPTLIKTNMTFDCEPNE